MLQRRRSTEDTEVAGHSQKRALQPSQEQSSVIGWLKKEFISCPHCGSAKVDVPWSLSRARNRRFLGLALLLFLGVSAACAALAFVLRAVWLWAMGGLGLALAVALAVGYRRSLTVYRCLDCGRRWT